MGTRALFTAAATGNSEVKPCLRGFHYRPVVRNLKSHSNLKTYYVCEYILEFKNNSYELQTYVAWIICNTFQFVLIWFGIFHDRHCQIVNSVNIFKIVIFKNAYMRMWWNAEMDGPMDVRASGRTEVKAGGRTDMRKGGRTRRRTLRTVPERSTNLMSIW